jgi:hypothetical protein
MENKLDLQHDVLAWKDAMTEANISTLGSFHNEIMGNFYNETRKSFEEHLKFYLIKNLKNLGYDFNSEEQFLDFCKNRIQRISFLEEPNEYQFYLDYKNEINKGTFIGSYSDEKIIKQEGSTITATIGKNFK